MPPLEVAGIFEPTQTSWDRLLYTSLPTAHGHLARLNLGTRSIWGAQVLNYFLVYLQPHGEAALTSLINGRTVGQAFMIAQERAVLERMTGAGTELGMAIAMIILALSALAASAILVTHFEAMSAHGRRSEFGF